MKLPDKDAFQKIYAALQDEQSREIYKYRLLYSILGDGKDLLEIIKNWGTVRMGPDVQKYCFYGAGVGGQAILRDTLLHAPFVIDTYRTGSVENCPILSFDDFLKLPDYKDYLIIITVGGKNARREIASMLDQHGLRYVFAYFEEQYFDLPELRLCDEYFVDAGGYEGETTKKFLDMFPNGHSYVFEASKVRHPIIEETLRDYPQAELFPFGLYDRDGSIGFEEVSYEPSGSYVSDTGEEMVEIRRLDDVLRDRKVTYIKMDIEGSELAALRGAERIIREQRPKLAICVYHKPEDMWEIPGFILSCHPDYKLYLRHYSLISSETILYAV